jgi:hypothetical protein
MFFFLVFVFGLPHSSSSLQQQAFEKVKKTTTKIKMSRKMDRTQFIIMEAVSGSNPCVMVVVLV